jgi:DNA (cytosine-5)-methyltransferase 1
MTAYYNEIDPKAAAWLRELISDGLIAPGHVDERSITDVRPDDLVGYAQCHFFAGVGGWSIAARLAGWADDRPMWSASCPCQPFSVAGKGAGTADARHLWPDFFRLVRARRPAFIVGEQVAAAVGKDWFLGVRSDLESIGYVGRGIVVPACAVNAPHRRDRLWFVAGSGSVDHANDARPQGHAGHELGALGRQEPGGPAAQAGGGDHECEFCGYHFPEHLGRYGCPNCEGEGVADAWDSARWLISHDGKARRFEPSISLLVDGLPSRAPLLRGYGNAIVPQVAAEVIGAWMDCAGDMA